MDIKENAHQLMAIMFADIEGYTALMREDEQNAIKLINVFRATIDREVADHGGRIIQYYGDAVMAVFPSSIDAVSAAQIVQRAFISAGDIPVRIGINSGDVLYREGNIFGDSVNIAARIESVGVPGSVLISKEVQRQVHNKKDIDSESLGYFQFKNIEEEQEVYALTSPGLHRPIPHLLHGKSNIVSKPIRNTSPVDIKREQTKKIAKAAMPLLSTSIILFVLGLMLKVPWLFFAILPVMLTLVSRIISIKLYGDPKTMENEKKADKRAAKLEKRRIKREAKENKSRSTKRFINPRSENKTVPNTMDESLADELELKELHTQERENWNDEDFV